MIFRYFLITFLGIFSLFMINKAHARNDGMVVLELFTSQMCGDSKTAEDILEKIINEDNGNVIALTCHVTFLDNDEEQDLLSQKFCDKRYKDYYKTLNLFAMQTPHLIINGKFDTTGEVESTVRAGAKMGISTNSVHQISITRHENYLDISFPDIEPKSPIDVWIFAYNAAGTNSVRFLKKIMDWDGSHRNMNYPVKDIPAKSYAIVAQYTDSLEIIAAGRAEN